MEPTKPKYRIVKRNTNPCGEISFSTWYYAQVKVLGIWFDLHHYPLIFDTYDSYHTEYKFVEQWLESYMKKDKPKFQQEVVKTYE